MNIYAILCDFWSIDKLHIKNTQLIFLLFKEQKMLYFVILLDFFVEDEGVYERFCEDFSERAYTDDELFSLLTDSGFSVEAVYGDLTEETAENTCERKIFVAKKK